MAPRQRDHQFLTINPGDILFGEVTKSKYGEDAGLKIAERNGKLWIVRVREDSIFKKFHIPIEAGDQILNVNGQNVTANAIGDGLGLEDTRRIFKEEPLIKLKLCRAQYGLYDCPSTI